MLALRVLAACAGAFAFLSLASGEAAFAQPSLQDAPTEFVVADVARLRVSPSSNARIVAHLRISTPVFIIEEDDSGASYDGWRKVAPRANPALRGYVSAGLISANRPSVPELQEDLDSTLEAGDFDGALVAAERLHALTPDDRLVTLDLIEILRAQGRSDRAAVALAALKGQDDKHIVYCRTQDFSPIEGPYVVASHTPIAGRRAAEQEVRATPPIGEEAGWFLAGSPLETPDAVELQKAPWYADSDSLLARHDLSAWALSPGMRYDARMEARETPPLSPNARSACPRAGVVRSNEPFVTVPLRTERSEGLHDALLETPRLGPVLNRASRIRAGRIPYAERFISVEVSFEKRVTCPNCPAAPDEITFHALYDEETGQVLAQRGALYAVGREEPTVIHVTAMRWGRWSSTGETFALIEWENTTNGPGGGAFVDWMVFDEKGYINGGTFTIEAWRGLRREEG